MIIFGRIFVGVEFLLQRSFSGIKDPIIDCQEDKNLVINNVGQFNIITCKKKSVCQLAHTL